MKFENTTVFGIEAAIRGMPAKGYRKKKNTYETFVSVNQKNLSLGTYKTENEAKQAVYDYRIARLLNGIHSYGLDESNCKVIYEKYVIFNSGHIFNLHGKLMIGSIDRCGYKEVLLNGKLYRVHRLVAETFVDNPENKPCVNHKDGNKLNNNFDNLEWVTYSENTIHAYNTGLEKRVFGESHHAHKLTDELVKSIRKEYQEHNNSNIVSELSKKYKVHKTTICDVISYKTWRHVQ